VHESWDCGVFFCVFVVLGSLDEGGCAVADAYEGYADFWQIVNLLLEGLMCVCSITFSHCYVFLVSCCSVCFGVHYFFFSLFGWLSFVFWFGFAVCSGCADSYKQY